MTTAPREVALAESSPRKARGGFVDPRYPTCRWCGCFDRSRHHGVASPRIPRRHFQVLHLRLVPLLRRTGITPRRCVSCFCRSEVPLTGDSVAEFILKILSSRGGKTRTGSLEHSGPVWQSERNFQASAASAIGLRAKWSVSGIEVGSRSEKGPARGPVRLVGDNLGGRIRPP